MKNNLKNISSFLLIFCCITSLFSQDSVKGIELINKLIRLDSLDKAEIEINEQITHFINANQMDSLYRFPLYIGKLALYKGYEEEASKKANAFVNKLKLKTTNARTLFKAYLNMDKLYLELGDDTNCVIASKKALEYANTLADVTPEELGEINYIIGGNYYALYDISNAAIYFKASAKAYEASKIVKKHTLADSYNGIATSMWTLRELDSAKIYFNKAIATTKKSDLIAFNRTYYINTFKFNLALVYDDQGNASKAIELKKEVILKFQDIVNGSKDEKLVKKSKRMLAMSLSNLAAIYNDIGYLTKAYNMLKYAYKKKKEVYDLDSPSLATTLNLIATSEIQLKEFDKSLETTKKALENLKKSKNTYLPIEAAILHIRAEAFSEKKDTVNALKFYKESESLFNKAYPIDYSREYISLLRNYSFFLSSINKKEQAISIAEKIYKYVLKSNNDDSFLLLKEMVNLSDIHYKNKEYEKSQYWAKKGITFLNGKLKKASSIMDSIQIEFYRPNFLLQESKSKYKLEKSKDKEFLKSLTIKLDKAIGILEKRKTTLNNQKDISNLLHQYKPIASQSKQLNYELYALTKDEKYLNRMIVLHESSIYKRIRLRLNFKHNISFANIPETILEREKNLKENLSQSLNNSKNINSFFNAENNWNFFLDSLKQSYPKYYKMRYATISEPLQNLQKNIPKNTTIVRYFFIEDELKALVINKNVKEIISLEYNDSKKSIESLIKNQSNLLETSTLLHELYQTLWYPFEDKITTDKVIIFPDRELYNLSFETLTPKKITSFKELATNSLLAKHILSYNYSLFLLDNSKQQKIFNNNFVAFAPEFNDEMKNKYKLAITDSISLDKTYLTLLRQPFNVDIAKTYSNLFNGDFFLNENSTEQVFKKNANEHKIIHVGTHAESNNISPELSRLIFAKNISDSKEDNSLYAYEIYNTSLNSNLAIITACETGKPSYQSGEGMISLAHAFNYAGSESILTSLWKVDERSSAEIVKLFYKNIKAGQYKDEALRNAKLNYLNTTNGRAIAPHFWAGLVLMGDTTPIVISTTNYWLYVGITILLICLVLYFFYYKKSKLRGEKASVNLKMTD